MNLLLFVTVTAVFVVFIVSAHFRFFGKIRGLSLGKKFDLVPMLEMLSVAAYLLWAFNFLFSGKIIYPYLITSLAGLILAVPIILLLRDFVPGLAYRTDVNLKPGLQVRLNKEKAEIVKLGYLRLALKSESGTNIIVPYSKIRSFSYQGSKMLQDTDLYGFNLAFSDPKTARDSLGVISNLILTSPWLPAGTDPVIRLIEKSGQKPTVEVRLRAISPAHARLIEQKVNSRIQKQ